MAGVEQDGGHDLFHWCLQLSNSKYTGQSDLSSKCKCFLMELACT